MAHYISDEAYELYLMLNTKATEKEVVDLLLSGVEIYVFGDTKLTKTDVIEV